MSQVDQEMVYEMELENPNRVMLTGQKTTNTELEKASEKSSIRLLIFVNKEDGNVTKAGYMVIVNTVAKASGSIKYMNVGNFTGNIMFYTINGALSQGYQYLDGSIVKRITPITSQQNLNYKSNKSGGASTMAVTPCMNETVPVFGWHCFEVGTYTNCNYVIIRYDQVINCPVEGPEDEEGPYNPPSNPPAGVPDCAGVVGGSANTNNPCGLCMGGTTGITECPPSDIKHKLDSFPCAKTLVEQMPNLTSEIASKINSLFGKNDALTIVFEASPGLTGTTTDGNLIGFSGLADASVGTFRIGLNPDILNNATKEYILVTLYHEALHAYLDQKKRSLTTTQYNSQFGGYNVNGGRLLMAQDPIHWPMAYGTFLNGLRDVIREFNPSFDLGRANALAKGGITLLSTTESNINKQEKNTNDPQNPGYTGTKCP